MSVVHVFLSLSISVMFVCLIAYYFSVRRSLRNAGHGFTAPMAYKGNTLPKTDQNEIANKKSAYQ